MSQQIVVTSGGRYSDVDACASAIAYAEILRLIGRNALAVLPGAMNVTVPLSLREDTFATDYIAEGDDRFVLVDISNPRYVAPFVNIHNVIEVYDHHFGYERFWRDQKNVRSRIEIVGAAATMIWERAQELGVARKLPQMHAALIAMAIASNTAGFNLPLTHARDRQAMIEAESQAELSSGWMERYFAEIDGRISENLWHYLNLDTKVVTLPSGKTILVGQLELSNAMSLVSDLKHNLAWSLHGHSVVIITSRLEGKTYFFSDIQYVHDRIASGFEAKQDAGLSLIEGIVLRKMLLPLIQTSAST